MRPAIILAGLFALAFAPAQAAPTAPPPPTLKCTIGPVEKIFGGTPWLVYSCDDQASMVVVSGKDNPAMPFVFFLKPQNRTYAVSGEGNGDRAASDAAGNALSRMTPAEFAALLAETQVVKPGH